MVPIAVETALHRVLAKSSGEPLKLSKVQNKVHKRLQKDHKDISEQQTRQLLQQVLTSSRQVVFDGNKVQLASAAVAAAPAHAPSSAAAATAVPAAASTGNQASDKRPRSDSHEHKQRKKHKAAKQQEQQQQQQHAMPAAPQHSAQAAPHANEQQPQQRHSYSKKEKQDHTVQKHQQQQPRQEQHKQQQQRPPEQHQNSDHLMEHSQHKPQQKQPNAEGHTTATAAHLSAADNALRVEIPADKQVSKSKGKRKHKRKQLDDAAAVVVPLPQVGEQQQQLQPAATKRKHKKREQACAGPAATAAAAGGDVLQQEQQKKPKKQKHQAEQPLPEVPSAKANDEAPRQTHTAPSPPQQQQQQQQPPHQHEQQRQLEQRQQQQQQQRKKNRNKHKPTQHGDQQNDQQHADTGVQSAKTAAVVPAAPAAADGFPQQQHSRPQQKEKSAAAGSARELLLQVMNGYQQQSNPAAAAATAAAAAAPVQQQSKASKPTAARHTVLAPASAAAGALAAVQNRMAAQQQQEQEESQDSPAKRRKRRSDTWRADYNRTDIKHGRFSTEEKEAVHKAIMDFAVEKGLPHGKGDFGWLIDRKSADLKKGATTAIAAAIPHRTRKAVWQFVQANYTPVEAEGPFTPEEDAKLLELHSELGPRWKEIGGRLGRLDRAVKDRAKTLNFGKAKTAGRWTQEEADTLQSFVSAYHQALEASGSAEGDVRRISKSLLPSEDAEARPVGNVQLDDIDWEWVSSQMETRTAKQCAERWHKHMAPGMIDSGQWAPGNDTTMIQSLAATPKESWQVNWKDLVPGRTAQQCKRRWQVILRHLPVEVRNDFSKAVAEAAARLQHKQQKKNKKGKSRTETA